jgi:hypothetical protein
VEGWRVDADEAVLGRASDAERGGD